MVFGPGWKTYAERLQHSGVSWRVYRQGTDLASDDDSDGGMNTLMAFERFHTAKPGDPLYHAGVEPRRLEALKVDDLELSAQWYDFAISAPGLNYRLAGHVESGRASFSDPASAS